MKVKTENHPRIVNVLNVKVLMQNLKSGYNNIIKLGVVVPSTQEAEARYGSLSSRLA